MVTYLSFTTKIVLILPVSRLFVVQSFVSVYFLFLFWCICLKWVEKYCEPAKEAKLADKKVVSVPECILMLACLIYYLTACTLAIFVPRLKYQFALPVAMQYPQAAAQLV